MKSPNGLLPVYFKLRLISLLTYRKLLGSLVSQLNKLLNYQGLPGWSPVLYMYIVYSLKSAIHCGLVWNNFSLLPRLGQCLTLGAQKNCHGAVVNSWRCCAYLMSAGKIFKMPCIVICIR